VTIGFHEVSFPQAIARGATGGPEYRTDVVEMRSGFEQRNSIWATSRARYNVGTGVRTREQMAEVVAFFRARKGRAYGFRFRDWGDFEAVNQPMQATGNPLVFQLVKTYGDTVNPETRVIKKPVTGTVAVTIGGSPVTPTAIDTTTGLVTFAAPPAATPVASFQFDTPVRFDADHLDMRTDAYTTQQAQSIPIIEIRI
jgi:uncharacterized protein (TIGR02217 family)